MRAFVSLMFWKLPSWLVVIGTGVVGYLFCNIFDDFLAVDSLPIW